MCDVTVEVLRRLLCTDRTKYRILKCPSLSRFLTVQTYLKSMLSMILHDKKCMLYSWWEIWEKEIGRNVDECSYDNKEKLRLDKISHSSSSMRYFMKSMWLFCLKTELEDIANQRQETPRVTYEMSSWKTRKYETEANNHFMTSIT